MSSYFNAAAQMSGGPVAHAPMIVTPAPLLVSAADLVQITGLGLRTIRRLDSQRVLPGRVEIGRSIRFRYDAICDWVKAGCPVPRHLQGVQ